MNNYIKGKTVAFCGMAPCIVGKGLGEYIDSFDVVIRTNVFPVPERFVADYGKKCDIISMLRTSAIRGDVFADGGIKMVLHYPPLAEEKKSPRLEYFHIDVALRNRIKVDIMNILGKNPGHGTAGINIVNLVLQCHPLTFQLFGVTGYQDKNGNVVDHHKGTSHYIDHFKIPEKIGSLERHPSHKLAVQNDYLRYLLSKDMIKMDQYSLEYFK
jgi:hypothetical protein